MIPENYSPAIAALNVPLSIEDAAARIADYTSSEERNISGLIGLCFHDIEQFSKAMKECGWDVELPEYMKSESAITWIGTGVTHVGVKRKERYVKIILHSFGSQVQVMNCVSAESGQNSGLSHEIKETPKIETPEELTRLVARKSLLEQALEECRKRPD